MKILKKIFMILIFTPSLFFGNSVSHADENNLVVEFQNEPLFSETNFVPGEAVTRYAIVTNNTAEPKNIITEAINPVSCSKNPCLSDAINFVIRQGDNEMFNDSLTVFLESGEILLSSLNNNSQVQYDFTATFQPEAGNEYQDLSAGFDLLIGFQGGGSGENEEEVVVTSSGGGGGGNGPPGLIIKNETTVFVNFNSVEIMWDTSYPATSQVIYREEGESYNLDVSALNYGYPHAYPDPEDSQKVLSHSVFIDNLVPGKIYYYRAVSHASPVTIGNEHFFKIPTKDELGEITESGPLASTGLFGGIEIFDLPDGFYENDTGFGPESDAEEITFDGGEIIEEEKDDLSKKKDDNLAAITFTDLPNRLFGISLWWWILLVVLVIWFFARRKYKK